MKTPTIRKHSESVRDSSIGPVFLLMLLAVSSFTSIVTELDAWDHVCTVAESILVVIARPATYDAVVDSPHERNETQESITKHTFLQTVVNGEPVTLVCLGNQLPVRHEPPPRQIPAGCSDRPRGPPTIA